MVAKIYSGYDLENHRGAYRKIELGTAAWKSN